MPPPYTIGLTGGIGSGKSTVAEQFQQLGVPIIDADDAARAVVQPGSAALAAIREHFGDQFITTTGQLNRRQLRHHVFANPSEKIWLEQLLHPLIQQAIAHQLTLLANTNSASPAASANPATSASPAASANPTASASPAASANPAASASPAASANPAASASPAASANPAASAYCLLVSPLLLETDQHQLVHRILVVDATRETQLQRTLARDNSDANTINAIIDSQMPRTQRLQMADDVIDNNGTTAALRPKVTQLHQHYLQLADQVNN